MTHTEEQTHTGRRIVVRIKRTSGLVDNADNLFDLLHDYSMFNLVFNTE